MLRWFRLRLGLAALCGVVSGCAVAWSPVADIGEPLESPPAIRDARVTEANAPAVVTATDGEPGAVEGHVTRNPVAGNPVVGEPASTEDDGLEKLIAQGRQQGTLSRQDEARLREDMADVPPHLRRQIVSTFLALSASGAQKPQAAAAPDGQKRSAAQSPSDNARSDAARREDGLTPRDHPLRQASIAAPAKANRNSPSSEEAPSPLKTKSPDVAARPVVAATAKVAGDESAGGQWQVMLAATIRSLEESLAAPSPADGSPDVAQRQAQLRMLYLLAGRRDDALRPIAEAEPEVRQFWTDWLYGTATYLDPQSADNPARRATLAVRQLEDALAGLAAQANLEVCNLAFCRRVTSFGVYESFATTPESAGAPGAIRAAKSSSPSSRPRYQFEPNQEVLLYAEVRNFTSRHTDRGYHTALRPSYQIFDSAGRRLGSITELGESHDHCQHRRRDFFVRYHLYLPSRIDPGDYKLKLTIEDVHSTKVAESTVEFSIGK
jgi:hypothetical protein